MLEQYLLNSRTERPKNVKKAKSENENQRIGAYVNQILP